MKHSEPPPLALAMQQASGVMLLPMRDRQRVRCAALERWGCDARVVGQWLLVRGLIAVVAAATLFWVPLPADPESLRLSPGLVGFTEVTAWLRGERAGADYYWLSSLWRYDAVGYLRIARDGYAAGAGPEFPPLFPLYPLTVRGLEALLVGQWLLAGLVVSAVASVVALCLLSRLAERELGRARVLAPTLLVLFPTAFFLAAPYAEALFLALSLGCLLAARDGRWLVAGLLGALSGLTRIQGVALLVPLLVLAWPSRGAYWGRRLERGLAIAAPLAGCVTALVYAALAGGPSATGQASASSGWSVVAPGWPLIAAAVELATTPADMLVAAQYFSLPLVGVSLGWLAWGWRRLPAYLRWYGVALLVPGLAVVRYPALTGTPRYLVLCVPLFLSMALWANTPRRRVPLVVLSVGLQAALVALFTRWTWIA